MGTVYNQEPRRTFLKENQVIAFADIKGTVPGTKRRYGARHLTY